MPDILGPASNAVNVVTTRPAEERVFGTPDTFFKGCSSPTARDGTPVPAGWLNAIMQQLRTAIRSAGVTDDNTDDAMLWKAIQAAGSAVSGSATGLVATVTSDTAMTVTAASAVAVTSTGRPYLSGALSLSIATGTAGAGGLDTGSLAANSWYYLWLIYNPTGNLWRAMLSLSATLPTLPANYTAFVRVGSVRTASGAAQLLRTIQRGRTVQYVVTSGSNTAAMPKMAAGAAGNTSTPTWAAVSVSLFVPPTANAILISLGSGNTGGAGNEVAIAAPNAGYGNYASSTNPPPMLAFYGGAPTQATVMGRFVLETTSIFWAATNAVCFLCCLGWEENL